MSGAGIKSDHNTFQIVSMKLFEMSRVTSSSNFVYKFGKNVCTSPILRAYGLKEAIKKIDSSFCNKNRELPAILRQIEYKNDKSC